MLEWRLAGGCPQPTAASTSRFWELSRKPVGTRLQSGAKNFAHLKLIKLSTYKTFRTKLIGLQGLLEEHPSMLLRGVNSMDKPNGRLVLVSFTRCHAFTPSLSTRWSFWALQGDLILGRASRLYAFSGYHNRTSLPSRALGRTTGTQEVRPSRSSRTKDSPPQISYAHSR